MTERVSLCVNSSANISTLKMIKPWILGDIVESKLTPPQRIGRFVPTNNNLNLEDGRTSVWRWDEELKYEYSQDITSEYEIVEVINLPSIKNDSGKAKIQEDIRMGLRKGINVYPKMVDDRNSLFVLLEQKGDKYVGIMLSPEQYVFSKGVLKSKINDNDIDGCYVQYGQISAKDVVDNGSSMPSAMRRLTIKSSFNESSKFPLLDLHSIALKIIEDYFRRTCELTGYKLTEKQIDEILSNCNMDLTDYAEISESSIGSLFEDAGVVQSLHGILNKINPSDEAVEKFLSRNDDFRQMCCDLVREEALKFENDKLESVNNEIYIAKGNLRDLKYECDCLEKKRQDLNEELRESKKLSQEIDDLKKEHQTIVDTINDDKLVLVGKILGESLGNVSVKTPSCLCLECPVNEFATECKVLSDFTKSLKKNLQNCFENDDGDAICNLAHFVTNVIKSNLNLIICNDAGGILADCISSSMCGRKASRLNVGQHQEISEIIASISKCESYVILLDGVLETLSYATYFAINRYSDKILLFSCDDKRVLDSAPAEIWECSAIADMSTSYVKSINVSQYTTFDFIQDNDVLKSDEHWDYLDKLVEDKVICPKQASKISWIYNNLNQKNSCYLIDYIRQIARSNGKISDFEKVQNDE